MEAAKLRENEFKDVLDVMSQRGIDLVYSVEPEGVFIYGSEDVIQQVRDILWACQVLTGLSSVFGHGSSMPEASEKRPDIRLLVPRKRRKRRKAGMKQRIIIGEKRGIL